MLTAMGIYLALGDSISIDDYTGVHGGGAASELARKLGRELADLTLDGNTTQGVLADLARAPAAADIVTLTVGGNDLLGGDLPRAILRRLDQIAERIQPLGSRVVVNTVYDPSDGDNDVGRRELGLSRLATIELRRRLNAVNRGIAKLARGRGFLLADLERLFHGHGLDGRAVRHRRGRPLPRSRARPRRQHGRGPRLDQESDERACGSR
jgi:lysophospholipase L1-like esterase